MCRIMNNFNTIKDIEIKIYWSRLPSKVEINDHSLVASEKEIRFYELLNKIGLISGGQIQAHQILNKSSKKSRQILNQMKQNRKILEHTFIINQEAYKIYTLGPIGAKIIGVGYEDDYWFNFNQKEAMQRIEAFDLYMKMEGYLSTEIEISVAEKPYIFEFIANEKKYLIGIIWDNLISFIELYRWSKPTDRTILVCKNIEHISCLAEYIQDAPVRAISRENMRDDGLAFYQVVDGDWQLDIVSQIIKTKSLEPSERVALLAPKDKGLVSN